jgi:lincosamide nucleotidyltransferase A/C/D/E
MATYLMAPETACSLLAGLEAHDVRVGIGGGWAIDALLGRQTREHSDLDLWVEAPELEGLFVVFAELGVDRIHPWPGDRPWNFVLHDGATRRVDLHLYESLGDGRLRYGSVSAPFLFTTDDVSGRGEIAGRPVRCERPVFALANHTGYPARDVDRHDVPLLCARFGLEVPEEYR